MEEEADVYVDERVFFLGEAEVDGAAAAEVVGVRDERRSLLLLAGESLAEVSTCETLRRFEFCTAGAGAEEVEAAGAGCVSAFEAGETARRLPRALAERALVVSSGWGALVEVEVRRDLRRETERTGAMSAGEQWDSKIMKLRSEPALHRAQSRHCTEPRTEPQAQQASESFRSTGTK